MNKKEKLYREIKKFTKWADGLGVKMISQNKLLTCVYEYIAETVGCTVSQLKSDETIFVMNPDKKENYIKILGIGDANIISLSEDVHAHVKKLLAGKNRDELFV